MIDKKPTHDRRTAKEVSFNVVFSLLKLMLGVHPMLTTESFPYCKKNLISFETASYFYNVLLNEFFPSSFF